MLLKNMKTLILWIIPVIALSFYFFMFTSFLFDRQEEMQLFVPTFSSILSEIKVPGGLIRIMGMSIIQYYGYSVFAAIANALTICGIGFLIQMMLRKISVHPFTLFLASLPVFFLIRMHMYSNYVIDGTLALLIMMALLISVLSVKRSKLRFCVGVISLFFLFWAAGEIVLIYAILLCICGYFTDFRYPEYPVYLITGLVMSFAGVRFCNLLSPIEGLKGLSYQESLLNPDSFLQFVWLRFLGLMIFLIVVTAFFNHYYNRSKVMKWSVSLISGFMFVSGIGLIMPTIYDAQNRMMDQLSYLARRERWEQLINMHKGKRLSGAVNRGFLNLALANSNQLGDALFQFDQNGPQGLLPVYDHTYFTSVLLSDIHFNIGDYSISESYAIEALVLSKRGGSPRMLKRLIELNVRRGEWPVADKYLSILSKMPIYKDWARLYRDNYLKHFPEKVFFYTIKSDSKSRLFSMIDIEVLWNEHIAKGLSDTKAFEYLGSSYLLAKEDARFIELMKKALAYDPSLSLPLHFQESLVLLGDTDLLADYPINDSVYNRFLEFKQQQKRIARNEINLSQLYSDYGNSYWFYHQYKDLNNVR